MGKIVLYTNVKGGVGKTTLCGIFATYLGNSGRTVAVVMPTFSSPCSVIVSVTFSIIPMPVCPGRLKRSGAGLQKR